MFKVSPKVAELVAHSQDLRCRELRHLDVTSRQAPAPDEPFDWEQAREAIGERLLRLMGTVARRRATVEPNCSHVLIMTDHSQFVPEVERGIAHRLGLDESMAHCEVLSQLAEDFYEWVRGSLSEPEEYGIECDAENRVFIRCPDLSPVLDPHE